MIDVGVRGRASDQASVDNAISITELSSNLSNRDRRLDRRDRAENSIEVTAKQTVLADAHASQFVFRRLAAAHDDRCRSERLDLLLHLIAGTLTDRGEHDHRPNADHDPQHRQTGAERVQRKGLDPQTPSS